MKIAVLGGGISGLAASHYLSHNHHATLFRGPMRGGWVNTYRSRLTNTILELGPRSLRHAGTGQNTLELVSAFRNEGFPVGARRESESGSEDK